MDDEPKREPKPDGPILTYEEMEVLYNDEWVLVDEPVSNENHRVLSGRVVWHGPNRNETYDKIAAFDIEDTKKPEEKKS